ncbi:corrinoid protein [Candidatus Bathyarchaeota archaeon]|nr:corrinoid protein [Candidatus Bathyarchaeota archaeon]MBS7629535.1 corrinoid protein [Candidatus Bathyarchaeota archaeon]
MSQTDMALENLRKQIIELNVEESRKAAREAVEAGVPVESILNKGVGLALEEVSRRYDRGEYFLSELVMAGEVVNEVLSEVLPLIRKGEDETASIEKGTVVIGTVHGDLHDIGKNIVSTFMSALGLRVIDLGVDVPPERFIEEVKRSRAQIMGLSCLLTTTLPAMKRTIEALQESGLRPAVKVIVGGRPVTETLAKELGADAYGHDAPDGARKALRLIGRE